LVSLGHRHIACIAGPQTVSTGFNRYSAFLRHRDLAGLNARPALVAYAKAFNETEGERCAEELLAAGRQFSAVVCANDRLAIGAISAFRRHDIGCPGDVSVTGFNDMPLADRLSPALTTVRVQHAKAGFEAAGVLVDLIENESAEAQHFVLPVEAVVRNSTARPRNTTRKRITEAAGEQA
jgi:LacI family transcriptional regulator